MKTKMFIRWFGILLIMHSSGNIPVFSMELLLQNDTLKKSPVELNGTLLQDSLFLRVTSGGVQAEVPKFMALVGGSSHPFSHLFQQKGFMVQYGRFISFSGLEYALGFVNCRMIRMIPPASLLVLGEVQVYFAPLAFLAASIGGVVTYNSATGRIAISVAPPSEFGSVFPPARDVAQGLAEAGFAVQQAEINKLNPIELCLGRYTPNANGNNAGFPYLGIQIPPAPGQDSIFYIPITFTLNEDEAVVMVGKTPPECIYFSYRSYLMNRFYEFPPAATRSKINASLGDAQNPYRMRTDLPIDSMFRRKFALIMAADSLVAMRIKNAVLASTPAISEKDIYFDIIPYGIFKFGNRPKGDWASFLHRASLFKNAEDQNSYINNPTLEIMRVTPRQPAPPVFFRTPSFLPRTSGINEFHLIPDMELLEDGIYKTWHQTHEIIWLRPSPWAFEGYTAIQQKADALGDVHDALYISTPDFLLGENDKALVYGVNHTMTGQAIYTNVTVYGRKFLNGFGGMSNFDMVGSARSYMADTVKADRFYTYLLARHEIPGNPFVFVVPADTNKMLQGINLNDSAFIGFRLYVNSITGVGPDPMEVVLDRALILRPRTTGVIEATDGRQAPVMKIFPNPVSSKTTLELSLPARSEVTLMLYNSSGQSVGAMMKIDQPGGILLQEIHFPEYLPSGMYTLKGIIREKGGSDTYLLATKLLFTGR